MTLNAKIIDQTRLLLNDHLGQMDPAMLSRFVDLAWERLNVEWPYRVASLFALSIGDVDYSREIMSSFADSRVAAERERCAKTADAGCDSCSCGCGGEIGTRIRSIE